MPSESVIVVEGRMGRHWKTECQGQRLCVRSDPLLYSSSLSEMTERGSKRRVKNNDGGEGSGPPNPLTRKRRRMPMKGDSGKRGREGGREGGRIQFQFKVS